MVCDYNPGMGVYRSCGRCDKMQGHRLPRICLYVQQGNKNRSLRIWQPDRAAAVSEVRLGRCVLVQAQNRRIVDDRRICHSLSRSDIRYAEVQ